MNSIILTLQNACLNIIIVTLILKQYTHVQHARQEIRGRHV